MTFLLYPNEPRRHHFSVNIDDNVLARTFVSAIALRDLLPSYRRSRKLANDALNLAFIAYRHLRPGLDISVASIA